MPRSKRDVRVKLKLDRIEKKEVRIFIEGPTTKTELSAPRKPVFGVLRRAGYVCKIGFNMACASGAAITLNAMKPWLIPAFAAVYIGAETVISDGGGARLKKARNARTNSAVSEWLETYERKIFEKWWILYGNTEVFKGYEEGEWELVERKLVK